MWIYFFIFLLCLCFNDLDGNSDYSFKELENVPVIYKGRIRPMDAYARLWLYEIYHKQYLLPAHQNSLKNSQGSALEFIWNISQKGHEAWDNLPLFWIHLAAVKSFLNLNIKQDRFSYNEIKNTLEKNYDSSEKAIKEELQHLRNAIKQYTEGPLFFALPGKAHNGDWLPLSNLKSENYNFTLFSNERFNLIRSAYLNNDISLLANELKNGYKDFAGSSIKKAWGKQLEYPSQIQLNAELMYYHYPLIEICIIGYSVAFIFFILNFSKTGYFFELSAFILHTFVLGLRIFILNRPPVSNMFETILYVPWICVLTSFILAFWLKNQTPLIASCFASLALLVLLKIANLNSNLENVQAVLDSQYWLIIHVLMIVGSYGVFILSAVLGHYYLIGTIINKKETEQLKNIAVTIIQSMYLGVALLIPGTILGGVWAAESWGRFWDWDPKEAWAFISACIYLLFIHAFTFKHILNFGIAVGSIVGMLAISFTWYGVNYILGTGLHSYGFGNGGEKYYYLYLMLEISFLLIVFFKKSKILKEIH